MIEINISGKVVVFRKKFPVKIAGKISNAFQEATTDDPETCYDLLFMAIESYDGTLVENENIEKIVQEMDFFHEFYPLVRDTLHYVAEKFQESRAVPKYWESESS